MNNIKEWGINGVHHVQTFVSNCFTWCSTHVKDLLYIIFMIILCLMLMKSCQKNINIQNESMHNISALTDSVKYYKDKNGDLVAQKNILYGDIESLRLANESLAKEVRDMKLRKPDVVVKYKTVIDAGTHDTTWQVTDTSFIEHFDFSNEYRELAGDVSFIDKNLSLQVNKDKVYADFTLAVENGTVFIKSDNPYVVCDDIDGFIIVDTEPTWNLVVGPSISAGYDPFHHWYVGAGISLTFGWNIKGVGKRIRR